MESIEYLKTMCPVCNGSIEFPMDALGQRIDCPHCNKTIVLGSVAPASPAKEMFGDKVRKTTVHLLSWLSSRKRQVLQVACALAICSVALFIYLNQKAEQRKREQAAVAKAEADAKAKQDQEYWDAFQAAKAKKKVDYAAWVDEQQRERDAKLEAQRANDAIVDQLKELNDTAERARRNAFIQNRNKEWILRYNTFANQWQYAPPDAVLKYNSFENRWEFVPQ